MGPILEIAIILRDGMRNELINVYKVSTKIVLVLIN
jgi:hypothetical protein